MVAPVDSVQAAFLAVMDRGRPSVRNPIQLIRSIVQRRNRSSTQSRSRSPPRPSNSYQFNHSHSISLDANNPPLYILINIDLSGAIIRPSADLIPGVALCGCHHSNTNANVAKQLFFCSKRSSLSNVTDEHIVSRNFVIPEISSFHKNLHKSRPLFFRLDVNFPNTQWGEPFDITFEELKRSILNSFQDIQTLIEDDGNENIDPIYMSLFDIQPSAPPPPPHYLQQPPSSTIPISSSLPLGGGVGDNMNVDHIQGVHDVGHVDHQVDPVVNVNHVNQNGRHSRQSQAQLSRLSSRRSSTSSALTHSDLGILIVRKNQSVKWSIPNTPNTPNTPAQISSQLVELSSLAISAGGASYPILSLFYTYIVSQRAICLFISKHSMPLQIIYPYSVSPAKTVFTSCPCPDPGKFEIPPKFAMEATGEMISWYYNLQAAITKDSLFLKFLASQPQSQSYANDGSGSDDEERTQGHSGGDGHMVEGLDRLTLTEDHPPPARLRSSLSVEVFQPPILSQDSCPEAYKQFWRLQAFPRGPKESPSSFCRS